MIFANGWQRFLYWTAKALWPLPERAHVAIGKIVGYVPAMRVEQVSGKFLGYTWVEYS